MRGTVQELGCFPTGRHYPGIADRLARTVTDVAGLCSAFEATTPWHSIPLAVIDFETTGLDPATDHIIEAGIVCFEGGQLVRSKNWLINPGVAVSEEARAVHGISDEELAGAPTFAEAWPELAEALSGHVPVAYNAEFDRQFLQAELARIQSPAQLPPAAESEVTWIDPLVWVRALQAEEGGTKLTEVCERMGIALERAHRAAGDAEASGRVLMALAERMPATYGELIRLQGQYSARQDVDFTARRNRFRSSS